MSQFDSIRSREDRFVVAMIGSLILAYVLALAAGWPQQATETIGHGAELHAGTVPEHHSAIVPPAPVAVVPFVLLLAGIAVFPLIHRTAHWWEDNGNRFLVSVGLASVTLMYYALMHSDPVEKHFVGHGLVERGYSLLSWSLPVTVFKNAVFGEYFPFIVLLFALYTISAGIRISGDLPAHPLTNTAFIAVGGALASFVGTTGAAMLLIRPLLETNSERKHVAHTVVFFILAVCNCGGCLLPIGDPPLFLGYLEGVAFLWTLTLWKQWAFINAALLVIYYVWDHFITYPLEERQDILRDKQLVRRLKFAGMWPNLPLLIGVVVSVGLLDPGKPIPGTNWHAWLWLREVVLLVLVGVSLVNKNSEMVRHQNRFNYGAIIEVAVLFLGIFICMQPALQILGVRGAELGIDTPAKFFWFTGGLSSVLDNAPTYLVFFKTAQALSTSGPSEAGVPVDMLTAISLGAVFMGAMTYIGNGPNFMVKSIAESSGVRMPSFFGYMRYSFAILLPLFIALQWLFF